MGEPEDLLRFSLLESDTSQGESSASSALGEGVWLLSRSGDSALSSAGMRLPCSSPEAYNLTISYRAILQKLGLQ